MAEAELEQIKQAARMIKGVENITVIDSFVVDKNDFLKAYKISRESGALYHDPTISGTVYQTEMGNKVLYGNKSTERQNATLLPYPSVGRLERARTPHVP